MPDPGRRSLCQDSERVWHLEAITEAVELTLRDLGQASVLAGFDLAGGAGLALSVGDRQSIDVDFFSQELFDEGKLLQRLQHLLDSRRPQGVLTL